MTEEERVVTQADEQREAAVQAAWERFVHERVPWPETAAILLDGNAARPTYDFRQGYERGAADTAALVAQADKLTAMTVIDVQKIKAQSRAEVLAWLACALN